MTRHCRLPGWKISPSRRVDKPGERCYDNPRYLTRRGVRAVYGAGLENQGVLSPGFV